ncbi:hypothetical protein GQ53DRAFT_819803 [Thozetella sp. PMI_491]|nr:hypothetical protein GQ53DRAFT_819803 [Thozetella sp. PMI_491]
MKVTALLSLLSSLALIAEASPVQEHEAAKAYTIKWCKGYNYNGGCQTEDDQKSGKCYSMPSGYDNACGSVEHSSGYTCQYYNNKGCKGKYMSAKGNYKKLPDDYDDAVSSYSCDSS